MGHLDIIKRAAALYDKLVVAVGNNAFKEYMFSAEDRMRMLRECCADWPNVDVQSFDGLLVDFAGRCGASAIVKGLRAVSDFEYEFQMAVANRRLSRDVETVFLMTNQEYAYLSSSIVKEIAAMGGDVSGLVPPNVEAMLMQRVQLK
jgi:pantetheine-phosphate adenylyltransferase